MAVTPTGPPATGPASSPASHPALRALRSARVELAAAVDLLAREIGRRPELGRIVVRIWDDLDRLEEAIGAGPPPDQPREDAGTPSRR
jgi:hypothetical protein